MNDEIGPFPDVPRTSAALGLIVITFFAMTGCDRSTTVATSPSPGAVSASRSVSPPVDQTTPSARPPRFTTTAEALSFIRRQVEDVRVDLPEGLPSGVALAPEHPVYALGSTTPAGWMLRLVYGAKKHIYIQYGSATFDGCGPEGARDVRVGDMPAVLSATHHGSGWWTELIWPATTASPIGRYGLTGSLPPKRMLRMARSMSLVQPRAEVSHNC